MTKLIFYKLLGLVATAMLAIAPIASASAKTWIETEDGVERVTVKVQKNRSVVMRTDGAFSEFVVGNPEIADVAPVTDRSYYVLGRAEGGTNLLVYDNRKRLILGFDAFHPANIGIMLLQQFRRDAPEVKALRAAQDGDGKLLNLSGREEELHMRGRFFQRLQQRVERACREHVNLVDDVNLVACRRCAISHTVDDLADVIDARSRGRVHLQNIDMPPLGNRDAVFANTTWFCCWAAVSVWANAVHALGYDPGGGRFARPAYAGHDERLRDAVGLERVLQRAHHRVLPDEVGKGLGAVLAGKDLVGGLGHGPDTKPARRRVPATRYRP